MITGKEQGTGKYSYHRRNYGNYSVFVSHMPEDQFKMRIVFQHNGETSIPILKLNDTEAELLWAALNSMSKDLNWKDME